MKIDVDNLPLDLLLLKLYDNALYQGEFCKDTPQVKILAVMNRPGKLDNAHVLLKQRNASGNYFFDYVNLGGGDKSLKINFLDFDSSEYNRYHGTGLAEKIILSLKKELSSEELNFLEKLDKMADANALLWQKKTDEKEIKVLKDPLKKPETTKAKL